jgi:hypothetical protein
MARKEVVVAYNQLLKEVSVAWHKLLSLYLPGHNDQTEKDVQTG